MRTAGLKLVNNELELNGHKFKELEKQFKTPLYILDEAELNKNIKLIKDNFTTSMFTPHIVYASKALLTPTIANIMDEAGFGIDAVSIGDLHILKESNFPFFKVVFHGNNKQVEELSYALENGVGIIVVDNLEELKLIDDLSKKLNKKTTILIRINPHVDAHTHKYIATSVVASKFGISIDDDFIPDVLRITTKNNLISFVGFHIHIGSSIFNYEVYREAISKIVSLINDINNKYHLSLSILNIGGGFGVPYTSEEKVIKMDEYMKFITAYLEDEICKTNSLIKDVYIEPGRSIIASAGLTLYTVGITKKTKAKNYLFIDGGMTDNIRHALYDAKYTMDIVNRVTDKKTEVVDVVGRCCESGDVIIENCKVPVTQPGDLAIVYTTGAYHYSMFMNYNNMLKPALIMVGKDIKVLSRREKVQDLMRLF